MSDLRYAIRGLLRTPGFTTAAVLTLAIGIGANTAIFSIFDHVILRPLGYEEADRLYVVHETVPSSKEAPPLVPITAGHFLEWQRSMTSFEDSALLEAIAMNLTGSGEPEQIPGARVSAALFRVLGIEPRLGRTFLEQESEPGRDRVVVLNADLWRRRFAGDPSVIGRTISLNGEPHEIVGVLPDRFFFPKMDHLYALTVTAPQPQIWKPLTLSGRQKQEFFSFNYAAIVRLKAGITHSRALAELNAVQSAFAKTAPVKVELGAALIPLHEQITGRSRAGLQLLLAAVGAVLLICCVNLTNLLLARGASRTREIAVRSAIGASPGRLARQLFAESLLLACTGGALGVAIAYLLLPVVAAYAPVDVPRLTEVELDLRMLAFSAAVSVLTGLIFGLLPAWQFAKADPQDALKSISRSVTMGRAGERLRSLLVSLEVGLSAVCLVVGALLLHSFVKLLDVNPGFEPGRLVTTDVTLSRVRYPNLQAKTAFLSSALERVQAQPGVVSAGVTNGLPLTGHGGNNIVTPEGALGSEVDRLSVDVRQVNPEFFPTLGIPLRTGRIFDARARDPKRRIAVVSELAAQRMWPQQDPLGKRFYMGRVGDSPLYEVIGVVADVRGVSLNEDLRATIYEPFWQRFFNQASIVIKTANDTVDVSSAVRTAIHGIDPELPIPPFRTMEDVVLESVAQRQFQMSLVLLFGIVALLLASIGIYGVVSYSVVQRTNEMGIRIALGAAPANIRALVLQQGLLPVAIGLAAGLVAALGVGQVLKALLFGVTPTDPTTLIAVSIVLSTISVLACYLPARRATRVDPMIALRTE